MSLQGRELPALSIVKAIVTTAHRLTKGELHPQTVVDSWEKRWKALDALRRNSITPTPFQQSRITPELSTYISNMIAVETIVAAATACVHAFVIFYFSTTVPLLTIAATLGLLGEAARRQRKVQEYTAGLTGAVTTVSVYAHVKKASKLVGYMRWGMYALLPLDAFAVLLT